MAASLGSYTILAQAQTISTAITILELTADATGGFTLLRAWVQQSGSTTSATARIEILRKTGSITGTATPPAAAPLNPNAAAWGGTVKWKATAEGTDGVVLYEEGFNVLNGWMYVPVPEERILAAPSGILALKFPAAPASQSWTFGMTILQS
jgi:hypothetical protein